jgi:hypothetical protein
MTPPAIRPRLRKKKPPTGIDEAPLIALAGGLAVGVLLAALLPRTDKEKELLGPLGERITGSAKNAVEAAKEAGRDKMSELNLTRDAGTSASKRSSRASATLRLTQSSGQLKACDADRRFAKRAAGARQPAMSKLHLVFGGRVTDPRGLDFADLNAVDIVGLFDSYADAEEAWRGAAQRTVDDAEMNMSWCISTGCSNQRTRRSLLILRNLHRGPGWQAEPNDGLTCFQMLPLCEAPKRDTLCHQKPTSSSQPHC